MYASVVMCSLVPRPAAQLPSLTVRKATESWAGPGDKARLGYKQPMGGGVHVYTSKTNWSFYN